jgi:hypothetical protein
VLEVAGRHRSLCAAWFDEAAGKLEAAMDESKRRAVRFLEKEIKTYTALSLFLSKKGFKEPVRVGVRKIVISPTFYKDRVKEAKKLVYELRKPS